ncbi:MAG: 4-deoxy-4-formamido-L-arabinose-phosphoundecaprenol deformylase [Kiritimatiellales bacterium]|nr:4-deoxy-4-formamido-L-arabinose-phosphoundecaprenol deformylase [Kiritimatiellales bacterium]
MKLGLRIDVDTYRGTKLGVPALCAALARHGLRGTFYFSVGPDNMGRHLWRLFKPAFLLKMLRSNAASLYGWDILLRGTFFPGPIIGKHLAAQIRCAAEQGHEIGLHAWDHQAWQATIDKMDEAALFLHLEKGAALLAEICGAAPVTSAVPGWKCNDLALLQKEKLNFRYNSDCRGFSIFRPVVAHRELAQPQIPVTLPTYDEIIGTHGIANENYNDHILSLLKPDALNVLTIHAEVEGIVCSGLFKGFLGKAVAAGVDIVPLGDLLPACDRMPAMAMAAGTMPGREGWVACQVS